MTAKSATLLGFDYGKRRLGVAVGQTVSGTATPLTVLAAGDQIALWSKIDDLIRQWQPNAMVVGIPYLADDSPGPVAKEAEGFATKLEARYGLAVVRENERLSSWEARQRGAKPHQEDAYAAAVILESYLERSR